jgi:ribosomal protein S18 acetylase RimI-like enzyme
MNYKIRPIKKEEIPLLRDFLYNAIFIPEGVVAPPIEIVDDESLHVYIRNFGKLPDDRCLVAESDGKVVGAIWSRIMNDYGHIDDQTPSIAISLYKEYRNKGIGTELLKKMLDLLHKEGYKSVSLSVQKANYAMRMYRKAGFQVISDDTEEAIMECVL